MKLLILLLIPLLCGWTFEEENWKQAYKMAKDNPNLICGYVPSGDFECCDPTVYVNPKECLEKFKE